MKNVKYDFFSKLNRQNVITIEIITVKHRTLVASVFNTGWKFGFGALALMGYFIRDWPTLQVEGLGK
jgi:hypothetical protein